MVISDIEMPAVDGYTLCTHIKSNPRLRHIPVILLSTLSSTEHVIPGAERPGGLVPRETGQPADAVRPS
jgi:CheY-like chemotaxis protein